MFEPKVKLPEEKIAALETWAEEKKKSNTLSDTEKSLVSNIESLKKSNWSGCRIDGKATTKDDAQEKLDKLKQRRV